MSDITETFVVFVLGFLAMFETILAMYWHGKYIELDEHLKKAVVCGKSEKHESFM